MERKKLLKKSELKFQKLGFALLTALALSITGLKGFQLVCGYSPFPGGWKNTQAMFKTEN